jgi:hypothetical protein
MYTKYETKIDNDTFSMCICTGFVSYTGKMAYYGDLEVTWSIKSDLITIFLYYFYFALQDNE